MKVKILIPIYNDWQSLIKILENINSEIANLEHDFSVIIVNDASTENRPEISANVDNFISVKIINMKNNKGHARCNASGLKYIFEKGEFDYVIPMDGDGEDRPEEIKLLLKKNVNLHYKNHIGSHAHYFSHKAKTSETCSSHLHNSFHNFLAKSP